MRSVTAKPHNFRVLALISSNEREKKIVYFCSPIIRMVTKTRSSGGTLLNILHYNAE